MKRGLLVMAVLGLLVSVGCGDDGDGGGGGSPAGSGGDGGSAGSGGSGGTGGDGGSGGGGGCDMGYTGPDCTDCATGYQDKDESGTCTLGCDAEGSVALNCGDNGTCDDSDGTRLCVCDAPWTGPTCEACVEGYELRNGFCDPLLPEVAGLRYRWDPDREASVNEQNEVTALNNLGSGAFALVSANGERPTLQAQAIGRRSAIVFDAIGEKLTSVMNTGVLSSSAFTAFVVFSPSDTSIRSVIGAGSGTSWGMWLVSGTSNLSVTLREPAGSTGGQTVTMDRPAGTPLVVRIARLNNVLQTSAIEGDDLRGIEESILLTTTATSEDLQLALGAGPGTSNFRGAIGEVLVFDSTVSGADTTKILSYLKEKWIPKLPQ